MLVGGFMWIVVAGRAGQFLFAIWTLRVASDVLGPAEMGCLALITSVVNLSSLLLVNPFAMFYQRHLHEWQREKKLSRAISDLVRFLMIFSVLVLGVALVFAFLNETLREHPLPLVLLAILVSFIGLNLNQMLLSFMNIMGQPTRFAILTVLSGALSLLIAVASQYFFTKQATIWLTGIGLGQLAIGLYAFARFRKLEAMDALASGAGGRPFDLRAICHFAIPVAAAAFLFWIQNQSYRFYIDTHFSAEALGFFAIGYSLAAGLIAAVESALTTVFQPSYYRDVGHSEARSDVWFKYARSLWPSVVVAGACLWLVSPWLIQFVLSARYQNSLFALR
jgi:O-antigen/teichoic acid export membrane protein